jgi:hypothetical protein
VSSQKLLCVIVAFVTSIVTGITITAHAAQAGTSSTERPDPPTVQMICTAGQFDVNTRDVSAIASRLGVGLPVAKRWVAEGPWLRPDDLLTVQGIGPGWLAATRSKLCALPPSTPPPALDVCTGSRVDIQTGSAAVLAAAFNLSSNAAANLVAGRPYAEISQITPERVPGVGAAQQARLASYGCLTPPIIVTASVTWRWAYSDTTTTDRRGKFALAVPAGTITTPIGGWLSITDVPTPPTRLDGFAADFHIWANWSDGTKTVAITLPLAPLPSDAVRGDWSPAGIHLPGIGEPEIYTGRLATTDVAAGTITFHPTSLSVAQSSNLPTVWTATLPDTFPTPPTRRSLLTELIRNLTGTRSNTPSCAPNDITANPLVNTTGSAISPALVIGDVPLKFCVQRASETAAKWLFTNNTGTVMSFDTQGQSRIVGILPSGDLLSDAMFDAWNNLSTTDGPPQVRADIPPGGGIVIKLPEGTSNDSVGVKASNTLTIAAFTLREISRVLPADERTLYDLLNNCGWALTVNQVDMGSALNCAKTLGLNIGRKAISDVIDDFLFAADATITLSDDLALHLAPLDLHLSYIFPPTDAPAWQPGSGNIPGGSGTTTGPFIVKRAGSTAAYVVDGGVAHHIPDGGTYICNAYHYPVRWGVDDASWAQLVTGVGADASCPSGPGRDLRPSNPAAINVLLRQPDGTAYLVEPNGQRVPLLLDVSHPFECWAQDYMVWDWVSDQDINHFSSDPARIGAVCGGAPIQGG